MQVVAWGVDAMWRSFGVLGMILIAGCGPSAHELRERTLSVLNTEAERWDGGKDFATSATDAYGRSVSASIEKGVLSYPGVRPPSSQMPTARPWDGYVRCYVSEPIVPHLRRAAAGPPQPRGEKRKGRRPVVAANVRLPRASRGHPGPANAHGLPVAWFHSPLSNPP
jgi:hypothetical protein